MGHGRDGLAGESVSLDSLSGPSCLTLCFLTTMNWVAMLYNCPLPWSSTSPQPRNNGVNWPWAETLETMHQNQSFLLLRTLSQVFCLGNGKEGWLTYHLKADSFTLPQCIPIYFLLTKLVPEQVKLFISMGAFVCFTSFISFVLAKVEAILLSRKAGIHCLVSLNYTITMGFPMWYTCIYWSRLFKRL